MAVSENAVALSNIPADSYSAMVGSGQVQSWPIMPMLGRLSFQAE